MTATLEAQAMMTPAELKAFQADCAIVRESLAPAMTYLDAEEQLADAAETIRQRWKAAFDCGAALKRIHDTRSYRDSYETWTAFMRGMRLTRTHCYRLMKCSEILGALPRYLIGKIEMPLSLNFVEKLGELDPADQLTVMEEAATIDGSDAAALERLRGTLQSLREHTDDAKPEPKVRDLQWARKHTTSLQKWFAERGADSRVMELIRQLEAIAEELEARKVAA